jgi:non-canonical purine NTP pyrophosphatase (RdgB/HAM1 family)
MQRIPVDSTDIVSIGYDAKARILEIEFKENRIYQYLDVAPDIHERFMRADSYGQYFFAFINGHYRYERIDEEVDRAANYEAVAFVTNNVRKLHDLRQACSEFDIKVEQLKLPVDEIQSHDPEKIALHKAKQAYRLAGRPVVVNDAFWNILALRGFPGAFMSYIVGWLKAEDFLTLLVDKSDRTIGCTNTVVYYDGRRSKVFSRDIWGKITNEPRGEGLSIEQIVIFDGQEETIAESGGAENRSTIDFKETIWCDFAKWYNLQRRLGKV